MKAPLLKFSLILCLLFLGFKNAHAGTTINDVPQGNSTIYQGQTNIPLAAISVQSTNGTNITLSGATFTVNNQSLTGVFTNVRLVQSGATFDPGNIIDIEATAPFSITSTLITFSNFTSNNIRNTTAYFYLIADYTGTTTSGSYQFTPKATSTTSNGNPNTANIANVATNTFTLSAPVLTLAADNTGLAATTQTTSSNAIAVYGMSATSAGTSTFTKLNFTTTSATGDNISPNYSTVTLYKSTSTTSASFANATAVGTATGVITNPSTVTINLSTAQSIADGVTVYYFLVVKYNQPTTADAQMQFNTPTVTSTNGTTTTGTATGQNYTLTAPVITITASSLGSTNPTASGLTASPVVTTLTNKAIAGIQIVGTGTGPARNITSITFDPTSNPTASSNSDLFGTTMSLYSSPTNTWAGIVAGQQPVATATLGNDNNNITFTPATPISIATGQTLYYFVIINYATPINVSTFYELDYFSATATGATVTKGTTFIGYNYSFPALTITAASLGSAGNNGLSASPIVNPQTNVPIYELQLGSTGTGPAQTINSLTFKQSNTQNNNVFYGNMYLYSSTSSTFMGVGASQTSSAPLASTTTAGNSANLTFSGLNITVPNGTPIYYFVLVDYSGYSGTGTSAQCELDFVSATGATVAAGNGNKGILYTYAKPTLALANNNAGALSNAVNLDHDLSQVAVFSFSATSVGTTSLTGITLTGTTSISANFSNMALYSSTSNTFPGVGSATFVKTLTAPNSTSYPITGLTESLTNTTKYYYVVADYTDKVVDASTPTYVFSLTAATGSVIPSGPTLTGATYTMSSPVKLAAPPFTNIAVNPLSTNASASGVPILGFSVTTTQAESFNKFVLTTAAGTTISPYFTGTPTLFVNTSASGSGGTAVPTGAYTVTATGITINLTTAQTFTGAGTKYYYLSFPTYTAPAASTTFELDASSVSTSSFTYVNGAPAQGLLYALGPPVYDWNGSTASGGVYNWTTPANWTIGGSVSTTYPGQSGNTDAVRFGVNYTYPATHQPLLTTSVTVPSILFGYNGGNGITLTVNGAAITLTAGTITQNNYASDDEFTVLTGTGNIVCTGDFTIGDGTPPSSGSKNVTSVTSTITHITINGNLNFNAIGGGNQSNNYPYFGLDKNQLTLLGQMKFTSTNNPYSYGTGLGGNEYYQNIARFNMDTNGANPTTLELQNAAAIPGPNASYYVDFTDLGGSSTVIYDDPNANETQLIYTSATAGLGVNAYNYINLKLSGASTKRFLGDDCTIGGDLTTDGSGSVDMFTNSPNVTIGDDWTNTTNVSQGGATISVGDDMTNNANTITCGSGTLTVNGQFTNAAGSFLCGTGKVVYKGGYLNSATFTPGPTPGMVYFTNTQTLKDNSTGGTMFNDVTCNNGTATMSSGNFSLSNVGRLYVTNNSKLAINGTAPSASFTLISDQNSTATVEALSGTSTITGTVNVQRYVTGGTPYRGYRSFSSPVNISGILNQSGTTASTNEGFIDPTYLNSGMLTGGPGSGFRTYNLNPLTYLYDDTRASSAYRFYSGKNVGVYSIAGSPNNTVTIYNTDGSVVPTPIKVPVGNAFMVYYAGTTALSNPSPESTVVTATGTLNQGTVNVWLFKTDGSVSRTLTKISGNALLGLNQIGNPYASTIQLSTFYTDNSGSIGPTVYLLDPTTGISGTYLGYNASTRTSSSTNRASNYVVSGQGFWITAKAGVTTPTIAFKETEKVDYPAITSATTSSGSPSTGGTLLMDIPPTASNNDVTAGSFAQNTTVAPATNTANTLVGLHLQLSKDSVASIAYVQTGIYFSKVWTDTYNSEDDAIDRDGATPKIYLSSYSSDAQRLCINQLADYSKGKRIKLYAAATTSGVYYMSLADLVNVDTVNYNIYLVDHKMNDSLDMVKYKAYGFNINTTDTSTFGANRFTLAVERKALPPYALITFSGQKVSNGVQLFWKTLNEGTYTTFALQKLGGSNTYSSIYTTQGTGAGIYADVDLHPSNGANTYRLQQTDINGIVTYSQPVTVNYSSRAANGSLTIYPNPSKSIINISLNSTNTGSKNYVADIYNTSGGIVAHKVVSSDTWTQDISAYKLGVYVIEIKTDTGNLVGQSKFVKIN